MASFPPWSALSLTHGAPLLHEFPVPFHLLRPSKLPIFYGVWLLQSGEPTVAIFPSLLLPVRRGEPTTVSLPHLYLCIFFFSPFVASLLHMLACFVVGKSWNKMGHARPQLEIYLQPLAGSPLSQRYSHLLPSYQFISSHQFNLFFYKNLIFVLYNMLIV